MDMCISLYLPTGTLAEAQDIVQFDEDEYKALPWTRWGVYRSVRRPNWHTSFKRKKLQHKHYEYVCRQGDSYEFKRTARAAKDDPATVIFNWQRNDEHPKTLEGDVLVSTSEELVLPVLVLDAHFSWIDTSSMGFLQTESSTWILDKLKMLQIGTCFEKPAYRDRYRHEILGNWHPERSFAQVKIIDVPF